MSAGAAGGSGHGGALPFPDQPWPDLVRRGEAVARHRVGATALCITSSRMLRGAGSHSPTNSKAPGTSNSVVSRCAAGEIAAPFLKDGHRVVVQVAARWSRRLRQRRTPVIGTCPPPRRPRGPDRLTKEAMAEGVEKSGFVILFLSEGVLERPFVQFEP